MESRTLRNKRALVLGPASQIASTASNALLALVAVHQLAPSEFGALAVMLALYQVAVRIGRVAFIDPILLWPHDRLNVPASRDAAAVASPIILAASLACCFGVVLWTQATWILVGTAACALGLLQDSLRQVAFIQKRQDLALVSDLAWLIVTSAGFIWLWLADNATPSPLLAVWGAGAAVGAGLLLWRLPIDRWAPRKAPQWFVTGFPLVRWSLAEGVATIGLQAFVLTYLAATSGEPAAGAARAAQQAVMPALLVLMGLQTPVQQRLRQEAAERHHALSSRTDLLFVLLSLVASTVLLSALLASQWLRALFMGEFAGMSAITLVVAASAIPFMAAGVCIGTRQYLYSQGHASATSRVLISLLVVAGLVIAADSLTPTTALIAISGAYLVMDLAGLLLLKLSLSQNHGDP